MKAFPYTPQTGDVAWVDYIPVKFVSEAYQEGTYNQKGFVAIDILSTSTNKQAWVDYVPIVIDDTRTDAWLVNRVGFIPVNFSGTGNGTASNKGLSLNFLGASTLDPRITFSRASNATVTNSAGLIQYAPHNLLTYSEQFDNAAWTKAETTITANSVVSPNGTTTSDVLIASTTSAEHTTDQSFTAVAGNTYTVSAYVKANGLTQIGLRFTIGSLWTGGVTPNVRFNLNDGTSVINSGTPSAYNITAEANGWYRVSMSVICVTGGTSAVRLQLMSSGNTVFAGNGSNGITVWGAQLNVGSLQPYYPTTVKNLLGYSEAFDNAAWTKSNSTVSANTTVTAAPNGTFTADKLAENSALSTHSIDQAFNVTSGASYTFSCYAKAGERNFIQLLMITGFASTISAFFDLTTGAVGTTSGSPTTQAVNIGNGWWRLSITAIANATATSNALIRPSSSSSTGFYQGITGNGIYVWGAQISDSASLDTYVNNPVAAPTAAAYYGARFDYDPVTLQPKGLLIEEQRTNLFIFSEQFDNSGWTKTASTVTANAVVSPDGVQDADKLNEDATNTGHLVYSVPTVVSGTTYTYSAYLKKGERDYALMALVTGFPTTSIQIDLVNGTVSTGTGTPLNAFCTSVGNGWFRCGFSLAATGTAGQSNIYTSANGLWGSRNYQGVAGSGIYVWGAQLEAGAFATSYIPTTASQVTRSADVALIQGSNFSGFYNQSEGTFAYQGDVASITSSGNIFLAMANDNTYNNDVGVLLPSSGGTGRLLTNSGGSFNGLAVSANAVTVNVPFKLAGAYKTNDLAVSLNGQTVGVDSTATIPSALTRLDIGSDQAGANRVGSGHIRQIAYYPRRLSNTELQAVTA